MFFREYIMKSFLPPCTFFMTLLILYYKIINVSSIGNTSENRSTPSDVLPLILIKTSNTLQHPTAALLKSVFLFWEKVEFNPIPGQEQLFFCAANPKSLENESKIMENETAASKSVRTPAVNEYCLFETHYTWQTFRRTLPSCEFEPEPVITEVYVPTADDSMEVYCGGDGSGQPYRFGYQVWLKTTFAIDHADLSLNQSEAFENLIDFEIYKICYNKTSKKVLYTHHKLLSPALLFFKKLKKENEKTYDMSIRNFNRDEFDFQSLKDSYDQLINDNMPETLTLDRSSRRLLKIPPLQHFQIQKLVPSGDFPFALWRKPTFHQINISLMHKELAPIWNHIANIIQMKAKKDDRELDIYTGTFNISNTGHEHKTISKYPQAAEIWVKIVYSTDYVSESLSEGVVRGVAIIGNNYMNDNLRGTIYQYCPENYCEHFAPKEHLDAGKYISCCSVTTEIQELFGVNFDIKGLLNIDELMAVWELHHT